eukprot:112258_1
MQGKVKWYHVATGGIMVGLPWILFKHYQHKKRNALNSDKKNENNKQFYLIRSGITTISFASIVGLMQTYYPANFVFSQLFNQWKWKILEMTFVADKYYESRDIQSAWQCIVSANIIPSRISFKVSDQNKTRMNCLFQFMEMGFNCGVLYLLHHVLNAPGLDAPALPKIYKILAISTFQMTYFPIQSNLLLWLFGLIMGNKVNIRYCYKFPLLSGSMTTFWRERWSVHIGEALRDLVYIPLGGKQNRIISTLSVFSLNALDHMFLFWLVSGGTKWCFEGFSLSFMVLGIGSFVDMKLLQYKKEKKKNMIDVWRYGIMVATLIGQSYVSWGKTWDNDAILANYSIQKKMDRKQYK